MFNNLIFLDDSLIEIKQGEGRDIVAVSSV